MTSILPLRVPNSPELLTHKHSQQSHHDEDNLDFPIEETVPYLEGVNNFPACPTSTSAHTPHLHRSIVATVQVVFLSILFLSKKSAPSLFGRPL